MRRFLNQDNGRIATMDHGCIEYRAIFGAAHRRRRGRGGGPVRRAGPAGAGRRGDRDRGARTSRTGRDVGLGRPTDGDREVLASPPRHVDKALDGECLDASGDGVEGEQVQPLAEGGQGVGMQHVVPLDA